MKGSPPRSRTTLKTSVLSSWSSYPYSLLLWLWWVSQISQWLAGPGAKLWKSPLWEHHTKKRERFLLHINPPQGGTPIHLGEGSWVHRPTIPTIFLQYSFSLYYLINFESPWSLLFLQPKAFIRLIHQGSLFCPQSPL